MKNITNKFRKVFYSDYDKVKERDKMLEGMGTKEKKIKNIPLLIENAVETVINPWLIYKLDCEIGMPKELALEEIENRFKINVKENWSEWCDFWFDSFKKIPHTILLDSKKYLNEC